jgi:hypothetical protein
MKLYSSFVRKLSGFAGTAGKELLERKRKRKQLEMLKAFSLIKCNI